MHARITLTAGSAFALALGATFLAVTMKRPGAISANNPPMPDTIQLTGTVRDFKEYTVPGGQADMERQPDNGFGRYSGNVELTLGSDGKPVFTGEGHKVSTQWRDAEHQQICHCVYNSSLGDEAGSWGSESTGGIQSPASFSQWFNDTPGTNLSAPLTITLHRQSNGFYLFDDKLDPVYSQRGGFFPIDNMLFGNSPGSPNHNFHFTYELKTQFTYQASANQVFKFIGDDDVWVYINGKLVIDLGGVHAAHDQVIELNRLGLVDGQTYPLDFFYAERHRSQSNFRLQTNLFLQTVGMPNVSSGYD